MIWDKLKDSRDNGLGVLLISADLEELIGLSDRIIVIYQGKIVTELDTSDITPEILGSYMTGLKEKFRLKIISFSAPLVALSLAVSLTSLILVSIGKSY